MLVQEINRKKQMIKFAENFWSRKGGMFMKSKYVMIGGFAFSEESDMEKLRNYAKKGWILERVVGGFFIS